MSDGQTRWDGGSTPRTAMGGISRTPWAGSFQQEFTAAVTAVSQVVRGKGEEVELALTAVFGGGHLLVEDVPGVGKTLLARCLAAAIGGTFHRIQGTPDLLPSDVTGTEIIDPESGRLEFREGPVFANVVLADELNRMSPKTQSALLEVMEEGTVSVGTREPFRMPDPFVVVATQNPADYESTYTLPDAQLDRFMIRLSLGYPDLDAEIEMLRDHTGKRPEPLCQPILRERLEYYREQCQTAVYVENNVYRYIAELVTATRRQVGLARGASPRAGVALMRAAQVRAAASGRTAVKVDDVQEMAEPVLAHRLVPEADLLDSYDAAEAVRLALRNVATPSATGSWR
ncbi:MoxR family ATPase [Actinocorallia sp. API 0066]|uniref:AAA family ATPase n=1 Tax=Actinocorallia sp. API 0066 TaxID=2896846 RepID=UPI001E580EFD|nr:MoxR family ATPase [Actinocorallia sp. API 0066]MCD0453326.1 MoxR family ATPase [Actinocorallia sp. API 0066]